MDDNQDQAGQQPTNGTNAELDSAKQEAIAALAPLVHDLDVDPERKFDLCMTTLRHSNDTSLVRPALNAALAIQDTAVKAESLLEIIDEITYLQQNQ